MNEKYTTSQMNADYEAWFAGPNKSRRLRAAYLAGFERCMIESERMIATALQNAGERTCASCIYNELIFMVKNGGLVAESGVC